jgi:hypothetical protein
MNLLNYSRSIFKELYFKNKTQTNHLTLLGCITIIKVMAIGINEKRVSGGILVGGLVFFGDGNRIRTCMKEYHVIAATSPLRKWLIEILSTPGAFAHSLIASTNSAIPSGNYFYSTSG